MTRAICGADFEERAMAESRCNAQLGIFSLPLREGLFIQPEELLNNFDRGRRLDTIKTECSCRMELRMADDMTARCPSLILALVFSQRRLKRHETAPLTNDALRLFFFLKDVPVRPSRA